jgi:hypothetical protein
LGNIFHPEDYRPPFPIDGSPVAANLLCDIGEHDPSLPDVPFHQEFRLKGKPVPVPDDVARELRDVLNSRSTYKSNWSQCFVPGLTISFGSGTKHVDALICLWCDRIQFYDSANHMEARLISKEGNKKLSAIYERIFKKPAPLP